MDWMTSPFRKYADFTGRATRREFWFFVLVYSVAVLAANFFDALDGDRVVVAARMGAAELTVSILLLLPLLSTSARRSEPARCGTGRFRCDSCRLCCIGRAVPAARQSDGKPLRPQPPWRKWNFQLSLHHAKRCARRRFLNAPVVKLVDALDSKSSSARSAGSSPARGTNFQTYARRRAA